MWETIKCLLTWVYNLFLNSRRIIWADDFLQTWYYAVWFTFACGNWHLRALLSVLETLLLLLLLLYLLAERATTLCFLQLVGDILGYPHLLIFNVLLVFDALLLDLRAEKTWLPVHIQWLLLQRLHFSPVRGLFNSHERGRLEFTRRDRSRLLPAAA